MAKDPKKVEEGFPEHGDEYHEEGEEQGNEGEGEGEKKEEEQQKEAPEVTIARLQGELTALRASRNTPEPQKKAEQKPEERDWEKLIFEDTPNAIKMLKEDIRKEITGELRGAYQQDIGEKEFWRDFYESHGDLKDDRDLVQATLGSNMKALQDLPVSEAAKKLADLTRARILRYKGGEVEKKNEKKTKVEGSGSPGEKKQAPEAPKILSLGDVIRARRAARNKKAVTA